MKYKRTKKCIVMIALLFCMFLFLFTSESRADEPVNGKVIILIDSSGSISAYEDKIRKWAEEFGAYIQGIGIYVDVRSFGDPGSIKSLYQGMIEGYTEGNKKSDLEIYADALSKIGSAERWTDQTGAIQDAVQTLKSSNAEKKCIIMLSDGKLDYEDDTNEDNARNEFIRTVDNFAEEKDNEVILVKFGSADELFAQCEKATILCGEKFSELALKEVFKGLGIKMEEGEGKWQGDNQVMFQLEDKDYYRVIVNIRSASDDKEMSWEEINEIEIFNGENEVKKDAYSLLSHSCYIYLNAPVSGKYTVLLPDGKWKFHYVSQEKIKVSEIHLSVLQDEEMVSCEDDVYQIVGEKCTLEIEVSADPAEQLQNGNIQYRVFQLGDGEYQEIQGSSENGIYKQVLLLNGDDKVYECQVKVRQGDMEEESEIIKIEVNTAESPTPTPVSAEIPTIEKEVGESINVRDEFNITDNDEDYFIFINGEKSFHIDAGNGNKAQSGTCEYENGKLTFLKEMEYMVSVKDDEGIEITKKYVVKDNSFCAKVRKWFSKLFG